MALGLRTLLLLLAWSPLHAASTINSALANNPLMEDMIALHATRNNALASAQSGRFFDAAPARTPFLIMPIPSEDLAPLGSLSLPLTKPALGHSPAPRFAAPPARRAGEPAMLNLRPEVTSRYDGIIRHWAQRYRLDPRLLKAIIAAESEFIHRAISPAGARGLMQLMPMTAEEMGVSRNVLLDPVYNIRAGAAYLAHLFSRICRVFKLESREGARAPQWVVRRVVAAYNAGPRMLLRTACPKGVRAYVRKVIGFYRSALTEVPASR
jgi:soluble lytic murein transglycosylase-like protein